LEESGLAAAFSRWILGHDRPFVVVLVEALDLALDLVAFAQEEQGPAGTGVEEAAVLLDWLDKTSVFATSLV
jgi:hypothetical protein